MSKTKWFTSLSSSLNSYLYNSAIYFRDYQHRTDKCRTDGVRLKLKKTKNESTKKKIKVRGGSWCSFMRYCRSINHYNNSITGDYGSIIGFHLKLIKNESKKS